MSLVRTSFIVTMKNKCRIFLFSVWRGIFSDICMALLSVINDEMPFA